MERAKFLLKNRQKEVGRLSEDQVTNSNNKCKMCKTLMTVLYHKQINWFLPRLIMNSKIFNYQKHGLRTSRESFFSKIRNFWAWADKLGWNFIRHLGYFWPNYKHYIGTVSPLSIGKCSWTSFLHKTLVFRSKMLPK